MQLARASYRNFTKRKMEKLELDPEQIVAGVALVATALLGGVARLLHDHRDDHTVITKRDVAYYCITALLAGIILVLAVFQFYGFSWLLFTIAGVAGFGSVQIIVLLVTLLKGEIQRRFGHDRNRKDDRNDRNDRNERRDDRDDRDERNENDQP